jgi:hypothetical protein
MFGVLFCGDSAFNRPYIEIVQGRGFLVTVAARKAPHFINDQKPSDRAAETRAGIGRSARLRRGLSIRRLLKPNAQFGRSAGRPPQSSLSKSHPGITPRSNRVVVRQQRARAGRLSRGSE